ncbi:hypothetical protein [Dactylosporangium sp. NPDC048998]|uniref:hypothetical protein n=1 Tax=Dactylosporangium sp. NPDC048998 TaxID=3363976 RepID=UPI00371E39B9
MGLAERRAAQTYRTDEFPEWKRKIDQAACFEVPVEVAWDELAVDGYAGDYSAFFTKVYFRPLAEALGAITIDDLGKDALKAGLEKIVVKNSGQYYSNSGFTFAGGVLTVDHRAESNVEYYDERAKQLQQLLESGL